MIIKTFNFKKYIHMSRDNLYPWNNSPYDNQGANNYQWPQKDIDAIRKNWNTKKSSWEQNKNSAIIWTSTWVTEVICLANFDDETEKSKVVLSLEDVSIPDWYEEHIQTVKTIGKEKFLFLDDVPVREDDWEIVEGNRYILWMSDSSIGIPVSYYTIKNNNLYYFPLEKDNEEEESNNSNIYSMMISDIKEKSRTIAKEITHNEYLKTLFMKKISC